MQPGSAQVRAASITPDWVAVQVACCLDVRSAADERADNTALMPGVLRLAGPMRVRRGGLDTAMPAMGAAAD